MTTTTITRLAAVAAFAGASIWLAPAQRPAPAAGNWYKGNLHTHTLNSDGDSSPDDVVRWYREHRYQFLVLTDHNYVTSVDGLNGVFGAAEKFLVVRGEEVSARFEKKPIHVGALNPRALIEPQNGANVVDTVQRNVDAIRRAGGVPSVNHPNFGWAITAEELRQVQNDRLFEVYNGHPTVHNLGGGGVPGLEEVWDILLTAGRRMYGIAVDDAHSFKRIGPEFANPGTGWVSVRAPELTAAALLEALERGDFYASTGVALADVARLPDGLRVEIRPTGNFKYATEFVGENGRVLRKTFENPASYTLAAADRYVRARAIASNGNMAWTQPVFRE